MQGRKSILKEFCLPPFTGQPIVENAVRCGLVKKGVDTLCIRSERNENAAIITVKDDGVGFDLSLPEKKRRFHVGTERVGDRLKSQCCGSLVLESKADFGTRVKRIVPLEGEAE